MVTRPVPRERPLYALGYAVGGSHVSNVSPRCAPSSCGRARCHVLRATVPAAACATLRAVRPKGLRVQRDPPAPAS